MGNKCKKEATNLGLMQAPKYTFYGRPAGLKQQFNRVKPKFVREILKWLKQNDPAMMENTSGGGRNNTYYLLSPQLGVYIEVLDRMAGALVPNPGNHVNEMNIYTNNADLVKQIIQIWNSRWEDGILPHLDMKKITKKYKVNENDVINAWKQFLG